MVHYGPILVLNPAGQAAEGLTMLDMFDVVIRIHLPLVAAQKWADQRVRRGRG